MKSIIKNALPIVFILVIFMYLWYFRPKQNALDTISEFKKINEKNNCNLIFEYKPNIIDFGNPWRYGTTETIIYDDPRTDAAFELYFPLLALTKIKAFNSCRLNSNYKYEFSKCLVFYSKIKDSLFFDEYHIDPKRFQSGDLNDLEIDSFTNLITKKYNERDMKVTKTPDGRFDFYLFTNSKYEAFGYSTNFFEYDCLFKNSFL